MKLRNIIVEIIKRLLYLTPIGYLISYLYLKLGKRTPGIFIDLDTLATLIKKDFTGRERIGWFVNGMVLLAESWIAFSIFLDKNIIFYFGENFAAWISASILLFGFAAAVYGFVSIVSGFFPTFSWNKPVPTGILLLISVFPIIIVWFILKNEYLAMFIAVSVIFIFFANIFNKLTEKLQMPIFKLKNKDSTRGTFTKKIIKNGQAIEETSGNIAPEEIDRIKSRMKF